MTTMSTSGGGRAGEGESFLTLRAQGEGPFAFYRRVAEAVAAHGGAVVSERCHATPSSLGAALAARAEAFAAAGIAAEGALALVGQRTSGAGEIAGVQLWLARDASAVTPLLVDGQIVGRCYARGGERLVWLPRVCPRSTPDDRPAQARSMFRDAGRLLAGAGVSWRHVLRTWIYLPDLLAWYPAFNAARREIFAEAGLLGDGAWLPASTGIEGMLVAEAGGGMSALALGGASLPEATAVAEAGGGMSARALGEGSLPERRAAAEAACGMSVLALGEGSLPNRVARAVESPVQCEAFAYGAAFARAVVLGAGPSELLFVSGTASIGPAGDSLHPGDFAAQARHTLDAVGALLAAAGHAPRDVAHAIVFVARAADAPVFRRLASEAGFDPRLVVETEALVCRPELLVELEVLSARSGDARVRQARAGAVGTSSP